MAQLKVKAANILASTFYALDYAVRESFRSSRRHPYSDADKRRIECEFKAKLRRLSK